MEYFTSDDTPPASICREKVLESDVYVAIIGFRYGSEVRGRPQLSHVELELETATTGGLPRLIYVLDETTPGNAELYLDLENGKRQAAFRQRLGDSNMTISRVAGPDELAAKLYQSLAALPNPVPRDTVGRAWDVPERVADFV